MSNGTKVVKRNGTIQPLNLEKMHVMVEEEHVMVLQEYLQVKLKYNQEYSSMMVYLLVRYKKY